MNIQWSITVVVSRLKVTFRRWGFPALKQPIRAAVPSYYRAATPSSSSISRNSTWLRQATASHSARQRHKAAGLLFSLLRSFKSASDKFLTKKKKPEPEVTQVLERAREYGSELIVFSFFFFFLKESTHAMKDMDVFPSSCGKFCFTVFSCSLVRTYVKRGDIIPRHVICRFGGANTHWPVF